MVLSNQIHPKIQRWIQLFLQLKVPTNISHEYQTKTLPGFLSTFFFSEKIALPIIPIEILKKHDFKQLSPIIVSNSNSLPLIWQKSFLAIGFKEFINIIENNNELHHPFIEILHDFYIPVDSRSSSIQNLINNLTFERSHHDFFGKIYESFLDQIKHHRGIYYTHPVISQYLVNEAISPKFDIFIQNIITALETHNNSQIIQILNQITEFSLLDPACGSGSFLLQAFWILNTYYHKLFNLLNPLTASKQIQDISSQIKVFFGKSLLDMELLIVQRHLFGIDKDPQAVALTSLNLWLAIKEVYENSDHTIFSSKSYDPEALFKSNFKFNLVIGDSLFGLANENVISLRSENQAKFLKDCNEKMFSLLATKKIPSELLFESNPVYFPVEFPSCFYDKYLRPKSRSEQGFDVIVGNPPYQRAATVVNWKKYYLSRFSAIFGAGDIIVPFIELSLSNLKHEGILGMIISNKILLKDYAKKIRQQLLHKEIKELMDLTPCHSIFKEALIAPLIFQVKNLPFPEHNPHHNIRIRLFQSDNPEFLISNEKSNCPYIEEYRFQSNLTNAQGHFALKITLDFQKIIEKIYSGAQLYKDIASINTGLMGFDYDKVGHHVFDSQYSNSPDDLPFLPNGLITPYQIIWGNKPVRLFKRQFLYPRLKKNTILSKDAWIRYQSPKLIVRGVAKHLTAAYDPMGWAISVEVIGIKCDTIPIVVQLALINSILFNWLHIINYLHGRIPRGSLNYPKPFVERLPMKNSDEFTTLALEIVPKLEKFADSFNEGLKYQEALDNAVFKLFNLSDEEITLIDGFLNSISH